MRHKNRFQLFLFSTLSMITQYLNKNRPQHNHTFDSFLCKIGHFFVLFWLVLFFNLLILSTAVLQRTLKKKFKFVDMVDINALKKIYCARSCRSCLKDPQINS